MRRGFRCRFRRFDQALQRKIVRFLAEEAVERAFHGLLQSAFRLGRFFRGLLEKRRRFRSGWFGRGRIFRCFRRLDGIGCGDIVRRLRKDKFIRQFVFPKEAIKCIGKALRLVLDLFFRRRFVRFFSLFRQRLVRFRRAKDSGKSSRNIVSVDFIRREFVFFRIGRRKVGNRIVQAIFQVTERNFAVAILVRRKQSR